MVWAASGDLGCGATRCSSVVGYAEPNALLLVCNYGPRWAMDYNAVTWLWYTLMFNSGNFIGQNPYTAGASCSNCPDSKPHCSNNLCTSE